MKYIFENSVSRKIKSLGLIFVFATTLWSLETKANHPKSPRNSKSRNGAYVTKRGAASRSCGDPEMIEELIPTKNFENSKSLRTGGYTTQARPDFWFYIPSFSQAKLVEIEFNLQDIDDDDVYQTFLQLPDKDEFGIVRISLPSQENDLLEKGQRYKWYFQVTLDCNNVQNQSDQQIQDLAGWIERYDPDANVIRQLETASQRQKVKLYQDFDYWFDAINTLASLNEAQPQNISLKEDWKSLFHVYSINEKLAEAKILDCCKPLLNEQ